MRRNFGQSQGTPQLFGPLTDIAQSAFSADLRTTSSVIGHSDQQFARVHLDLDQRCGGFGMLSDVGQTFAEYGERMLTHTSADDGVDRTSGPQHR